MTEIDNSLLEQFFEPARQQEISDNGFTERVLRQLPDRSLILSRWWTAFCAALALILFIVSEAWRPLLVGAIRMVQTWTPNDIHPVPIFMTMGVLTCLALLEVHAMYVIGTRNFHSNLRGLRFQPTFKVL